MRMGHEIFVQGAVFGQKKRYGKVVKTACFPMKRTDEALGRHKVKECNICAILHP